MKNFIISFLIFLFCISSVTLCAQAILISDTLSSKVISAPDYSSLFYWAAHPWKKDLADSVPAPLKKNYHPDSAVDIFFIHPTSYTGEQKEFGWNAPVDDSAINQKTDNRSILYQASIFNEAGRVFAPRYRQAHLSAYYTHDTATALTAFDTAYEDVKAAFQYYMENYNNGRPIIIASHSQGTTHAKRLLKEFFDGTPLQNKLVVAYIVGMFVEPDCFTSIKPCTAPSQTECFCSWRTYREDYEPLYVKKEKFTAVVTNPLTWDANKPVAPRSANEGSVLLHFNKVIPNVVNASVHDGVLWVNKPHFFGNVFYTAKNYHVADYNFFYMNVRENVKQRIDAYFKNYSSK
ncbi:MAG: DUF3089 domain-containing protein [Parafilimonas sp.]